MANSKRKEYPTKGDAKHDKVAKRSKAGSGGKWQTPHAKLKMERKTKIEAGDQGIWATCVKGKEGKCTEELKILFDYHVEKFYGLQGRGDVEDAAAEDGDDHIAAAIEKEIAALNGARSTRGTAGQLFTAVWLDMPCVLFFKTRRPIEPVEFVRRICEGAAAGEPRRSRFVNRLTPMSRMGRASEKGLDELGRAVLGEAFGLVEEGQEKGGGPVDGAVTYAIRPTIRANNSMKRDAVIKQVANLIQAKHKVDLTKPDKVIVVEIYQTVCGMSVVGGDWEALKRFNLAEIYQPKHALGVGEPSVMRTQDDAPAAEAPSKLARTDGLAT